MNTCEIGALGRIAGSLINQADDDARLPPISSV